MLFECHGLTRKPANYNKFQMLNALVEKLKSARTIILTTHRQCDGDGLGAQIALCLGLRQLGKSARVINVDTPARKYSFLETDRWIEVLGPGMTPFDSADLGIILDTNDGRLVEPLYSRLRERCRETLFIDHHPVLSQGPQPPEGSLIDVAAASTGELVFEILKGLGVQLDARIARALYTSLVFDTQLFRFVKSRPSSHLMAAELLKYELEPEFVHRKLFANYSVEKMRFFIKVLAEVEYLAGDRIALIPLRAEALARSPLDRDESGDIIDQVMTIGSIEVAALMREDSPNSFKFSLRSKGTIEVLGIAESFGGGGHRYSSGAHVKGSFSELRERLVSALHRLVPHDERERSSSGSGH